MAEVARTDGFWNWALVSSDPGKLPLVGGGSGSVDEFRECLVWQRHVNVTGLLRMTFGTGRLARVKYIIVHFAGAEDGQAPPTDRGRGRMEKALAQFANITATLEVARAAEFTVDWLISRLRKIYSVDEDALTAAFFEEAERYAKSEQDVRRRGRLDRLAKEMAREEAKRKAEELEAEARERERMAATEAAQRAFEKAEREAEAAERRRLADEERRERALIEGLSASLQEAVGSRDPDRMAARIEAARQGNVPCTALREAEDLLRGMLDLEEELRRLIDLRKYLPLEAAVARAVAMGIGERPLAREAGAVLSGFRRQYFQLEFERGGVGPRGSGEWLGNPTVELQVGKSSGSTAPAEVAVVLEDLSGDAKYGFHVVANPHNVPASCPAVVPGGHVLAEGRMGPDRRCCAGLELPAEGRFYCVASPASVSREGGRARLGIFSEVDVCCRVLPATRWPFETAISWEWSLAGKTAGGPKGSSQWLQNPQLRVYLETPRLAETVCVMVILVVSGDGPSSVSLHAVRNKRALSYNLHAAVVPHSHEVIAAPKPVYQASGVGICFELRKQDLVVEGASSVAPPFYLVPSAEGDGPAEGAFELRVCASAPLRCERVTARAAGSARNASPVSVRRATSPCRGGEAVQRRPSPSSRPSSPLGCGTTPKSGRPRMHVQLPGSLPPSPDSGKGVPATFVAAPNRPRPGSLVETEPFKPGPAFRLLLEAAGEKPETPEAEASLSPEVDREFSGPRTPTTISGDDQQALSPDGPLPVIGSRAAVSERCASGTAQQVGIVRFVGEVAFADGVWVGLALEKPTGRNDGTVSGRRYFECQPGHGLFVRPGRVEAVAPDSGAEGH